MPLPALAALGSPLGLGALSTGSSLLTTLLGNKGSKAQTDLGYQAMHKASKTYDQTRHATLKFRNEQHGLSDDVYDRGNNRNENARDRNLDLAGDLREGGRKGFRSARDKNIGTLRTGLDKSNRRIGNTVDANIDTLRGTRSRSLDRTSDAVDSNIDTLRGARNRSVGRLDPYADAGTNAMQAYASNLGLGSAPAGYTGLEHSAGAKFQLEQGRKQVEGGATGAGGLYSGETLAELERLRNGNVLMDRDNQMAQMFALGGQGLNAAGQIGNIEGQYGQDVSGQRQWGAGEGNRIDENYGRDASNVRQWGTTGQNAADAFYRPQIADERSQYATNAYNTNTNFANMGTQANNQFADRGLALDQNHWNNNFNSDSARSGFVNGGAASMLGAYGNGANMAGQGAAQGGQLLQQGVNSAINNGVYTYAQQGGTNPWALPQPASTAPYQVPQPFTGGGGAGMSQRRY
jgi:hypothetical protein